MVLRWLKLCPLMAAIFDGGILKVDHLRTIHVMFALNWLTGFRGPMLKLCPLTVAILDGGRGKNLLVRNHQSN
jgi:hypothetical protein